MKKILTLALTVSCVVGLAGCAVQPVQLTEEQSRLLASTWSYGEGTAEAKSRAMVVILERSVTKYVGGSDAKKQY